ncbi:MAG: hypothetical protein V3S70_04240, partial [Gammaproteobacteria bacterium]
MNDFKKLKARHTNKKLESTVNSQRSTVDMSFWLEKPRGKSQDGFVSARLRQNRFTVCQLPLTVDRSPFTGRRPRCKSASWSSLMILILAGTASAFADTTGGSWAYYGGDAGGQRYSALTQINGANVGQLRVAWTY